MHSHLIGKTNLYAITNLRAPMKNWKSKVLYGLFIFLIAACAPQPGAVHTSNSLFGSGNQCKAMARKQLRLARNAGRSGRRNHRAVVASTLLHKRSKIAAIPNHQEKFVYSRYLLPDTTYFPEALASLSEGSLTLSTTSKTDAYLTS